MLAKKLQWPSVSSLLLDVHWEICKYFCLSLFDILGFCSLFHFAQECKAKNRREVLRVANEEHKKLEAQASQLRAQEHDLEWYHLDPLLFNFFSLFSISIVAFTIQSSDPPITICHVNPTHSFHPTFTFFFHILFFFFFNRNHTPQCPCKCFFSSLLHSTKIIK